MSYNPFVALWEAPVATLTALAYILVLLATTIALAGVTWRLIIETYTWVEHRWTAKQYGPEWQLVPPLRVVGMASLIVFLAAIELALIAGIIHILT